MGHATHGGNRYSDDQREFIKAKRQAGLSAAQMAEAFFRAYSRRVSRNAMIGIISRMGLTRSAVCRKATAHTNAAIQSRAAMEETPKPEKPRPPKPAPMVRAVSFGPMPGAAKKGPPAPPPPPAESRSLSLSLRGCGCAYPTGEQAGEVVYCGLPVAEDMRRRPYCAAHLRIMYPAQAKPYIRAPFDVTPRSAAPRDASFLSRWG